MSMYEPANKRIPYTSCVKLVDYGDVPRKYDIITDTGAYYSKANILRELSPAFKERYDKRNNRTFGDLDIGDIFILGRDTFVKIGEYEPHLDLRDQDMNALAIDTPFKDRLHAYSRFRNNAKVELVKSKKSIARQR